MLKSDFHKIFKKTSQGLTLHLKVSPQAAQNKIGSEILEGETALLKVFVTKAPEQGKANEAVLSLLAKSWGLRKGQMKVLKGENRRQKLIFIEGDPETLLTQIFSKLK